MKTIRNILIIVVLFLVLVITFLFYVSPQKTTPFTDENGNILPNSVAEILALNINGVSQRLLIRGKDKNNPVLLHLHGGPGVPDYPLIKEGKVNIEDIFTVCYWDQRGAGASFKEGISNSSMNLKQIVNDGEQVTLYLLDRFKKDKIFLQGHSWGSIVGSFLAQKSPDLFHAYIGIGQVGNNFQSEQISYDYALAESKKANYLEGIEILEKIGRPPYQTDEEWQENSGPQRMILGKFENPNEKTPKSTFDYYSLYTLHREYSLSEKLNFINGMDFSEQNLWLECVKTNLLESIPVQKIPVYILQGKYDKHTCTAVAKNYFDTLNAPTKKYVEFENSAHEPHITEFKKYKEILQNEVLKNYN